MRDPMRRSGLIERALAPLVALTVGAGAGGLMQMSTGATHLSVAAFIMCAYTSGILVIARQAAVHDWSHRRELSRLPVNSTMRRVGRLLRDPMSWWSLLFGIAVIVGSAWWGGIRLPERLALVGLAWTMVNVLLNYELTLLHPTTRCRRCAYQLIGQLDPGDPNQVVQCPECGAVWNKSDLCLSHTAQDDGSHRPPHARAARGAARRRDAA